MRASRANLETRISMPRLSRGLPSSRQAAQRRRAPVVPGDGGGRQLPGCMGVACSRAVSRRPLTLDVVAAVYRSGTHAGARAHRYERQTGRQAERQKRRSPALRAGLRGVWWPGAESNCRHADFQSAALPTELPGRFVRLVRLVRLDRLLRVLRPARIGELKQAVHISKPLRGPLEISAAQSSSSDTGVGAAAPPAVGRRRGPRPQSTPSCLSLRYRWVRSSPVLSATRVMLPPSRARWNSK